ncbi:hypothetical protein E2C01_083094 [Portunus trituberculatus]|uniref:Uncharacterized protein n=1 Tax=Portunus trituberculatus TaxID=210409 RepID=A0A5B7J3K8_PORTR|nr:hypothetical protein [Portunus trituberculatus]
MWPPISSFLSLPLPRPRYLVISFLPASPCLSLSPPVSPCLPCTLPC